MRVVSGFPTICGNCSRVELSDASQGCLERIAWRGSYPGVATATTLTSRFDFFFNFLVVIRF